MFYCPNCGEPVHNDNASVCPHCGSDEETGWHPDADYRSVDIPEPDDPAFSDSGQPEAGGPISTPFAIFLVCLILLGCIALLGRGGMANLFSFMGVLAIAAILINRLKHRRRRPPTYPE